MSALAEIWYPDLFEYAEFNGDVHLFCLRPQIIFLGKFGPKNQNCQFKQEYLRAVGLSCILALRLIWICKIQWWC